MFAKKSISLIFSVLFVIVFMLAVTPLQAAHAAGVRYAKPIASGTGDCSSWANACTLQTALTGAVSGDEIWVKAGTYKPTTGTDRTATFQLKDGVAVYGGFAGTETRRDQRNPAANVAILSGEIGTAGNSDNSYHVVIGATGATLDGFTITAGNANTFDSCPGTNCGGGMINYASNPTLTNVTFSGNSAGYGGGLWNYYSSPALTDVVFSGNLATSNGGGMLNSHSSPTLTEVTFSGNTASNSGGGMDNGSNSNPTLTEVTFSGNTASNSGGGMFNLFSNPTLTNVTFSGNTASGNSATYYGGGGMKNSSSSPTLTNVTFNNNSTIGDGGGMYNFYSSSPTLTNVTFSGNSSAYRGGGMYNYYSSSPQIRNTIFWGNTAATAGAQIYTEESSTPSVSDSVVQGGCPAGSTCTNIITADPVLGPLGNYGGFTQSIPLLPGSSAIDAGNDSVCPATDQRGVARPQGAHCDIGAYEVDTTPPMVNSISRFNPSPTNLASVDFTTTFSEAVMGVDVSGFSLTTTGVSGASVTGISGSGSVYTVTVNTGSGNGTIRLDVPISATSATVTDIAGNPLAGLPYTGGETYTINKVFTIFLPLILH